MSKSHYLDLTTFNVWAHKKITGFITDRFSDGQEEVAITSSFSSVKKTIYHVWDAEMIWLERLRGFTLTDLPGNTFKGNFREGLQKFNAGTEMLPGFLVAKDESYFSGDVSYYHSSGKYHTNRISDVLTHVVNHGTYHRGQLVTMLRQLGFTEGIPKTDYIAYCREKAAAVSSGRW